jgi:HEAT repeat protein
VARALELGAQRPDQFNQREYVKALAVWGTERSVPVLAGLLTDKTDVFTRAEALKALGAFPDPRAAEAVAKYLPNDMHGASRALETMGPVAEPAVLLLLKHDKPEVRCAACRVLTIIGTKRSIPALEGATHDLGPFVAQNAREALAVIDRRP